MEGCLLLVSFSVLIMHSGAASVDGFVFTNGFRETNISLDGSASIAADGLLTLTNATKGQTGHAFYSVPLSFRRLDGGGVLSFSTTFVFAIVPVSPDVASYGMALVISPTDELPRNPPGPLMGLFNATNNGNATNHILAVEFDTTVHSQYGDIDDNHVGIDVNGVVSFNSSSAAYYNSGTRKENLTLASGNSMQAWVDYHAEDTQLIVTIAPAGTSRPERPLLSSVLNLSGLFLEPMYVGFSASAGKALTSQYVRGWSFRAGGMAEALDLARLPRLPQNGNRRQSNSLAIWLPISLSLFVLVAAWLVLFVLWRKKKFAEVREDWELDYGPQRFSYNDLYRATKGFRESRLLGFGGFGEVYKGELPVSKTEVAVKKIAHDSRQGTREFIAEIVSLGRLRHRNLVQLLGYSRRKDELFLVYDFMPNGSLDNLLFGRRTAVLSWARRFHVIKGVAAGLLYLHEEWEQVVIHRDVKASNVLLDADFNGRLGDFGLSRIYDHGSGPNTTHVMGTTGYMAPEMARNGKATKATDVYAYGAFLLEVACGRRPIEQLPCGQEQRLVTRVLDCWRGGKVLEAADPRLGREYDEGEMAHVLMLGLLCCNPSSSARPGMRRVVQLLEGNTDLPEPSPEDVACGRHGGSNGDVSDTNSSYASSVLTESVLSGGR